MNMLKALLLMVLSSFCNVVRPCEPFSLVCTVGYLGATALDSLSSLVPNIGYKLYGSSSVPLTVEVMLHGILYRINFRHATHLPQPVSIKKSYYPWSVIAGNIFSNQNTLFISDNVSNTLMQGLNENKNIDALFASLGDQEKKALIVSSLMMAANYDNKVLALSYAVNCMTKKIQEYFPLDPIAYSAHKIAKKIKTSFKAKALISALIVGAYIVYQRHTFDLQAQNILQ